MREAWESQDFNRVWTRDLAIPVRRSNQLSYEATEVGSWSFVSSNEPVKNGCEVICEMFHILNCGFEIKWAMIIAVIKQLKQLRMEAWKSQEFNGVWTHQYGEVTGSNPVELLTFSGFHTQLLKLLSFTAMIRAHLIIPYQLIMMSQKLERKNFRKLNVEKILEA